MAWLASVAALLAPLGPAVSTAAASEGASGCFPTRKECTRIVARSSGVPTASLPCAVDHAFRSGELVEARDLARRLLWTTTGPFERACATEALGNVHYYLGAPDAAARSFAGSLAVFRDLGDSRRVALRWKDLGVALRAGGRFDEALRAFESAREADPDGGDGPLAVSLLGNLGDLWARVGSTDLAIEAFEEALEIARREDPPDQVYDALLRLGNLHAQRGALERSRERLAEAAVEAGAGGFVREESWIQGELASVARALGRDDEAAAALERSLALARASGDDFNTVASLVDLAELRTDRGQLAGAADLLARAAASRSPEVASLRPRVRTALGELHLREGRIDLALTELEGALELADAFRRRLLATQDRHALGHRFARTVHAAIEGRLLRDAPGDREAAFRLAETSLGRTFLEELAAARVALDSDLPPGLAARHRRLTERRRAILEDRANAPKDDDALRLQEIELALDEVVRAAARRSGSSLLAPDPPSPGKLGARLPAGSAYLALHPGRAAGTAFLVDARGLRTWTFPVGRRELERRLEIWRDTRARGRERGVEVLREWLLGPLLDAPPPTTLVVAPGPGLRQVPFHALWPGDAAPPTALVPSATVLLALLDREGPPLGDAARVLALGDPEPGPSAGGRDLRRTTLASEGLDLAPLPASRDEALRVARRGGPGSRALVGADATEDALLERRPEDWDVLHFATHALVGTRLPARSGLVLGAGAHDDGLWQAREVALRRLRAELVVLAACRTARASRDGSVHGLAGAFLLAGARTAVASLRDVEDSTTGVLVEAFYDELARGTPKALAFARARRTTLERVGERARSGTDAFVLVGDPWGTVPVRSSDGIGRRRLAALFLLGAGLTLGLASRRAGRSSRRRARTTRRSPAP